MSDLISRGKLFNLLAPVQTLGEAYGIIQEMPTVDAVPVRHGKWLPENRTIDAFWVCSACGFTSEAHAANILYQHCPNCGAKMDGKGNGNETD